MVTELIFPGIAAAVALWSLVWWLSHSEKKNKGARGVPQNENPRIVGTGGGNQQYREPPRVTPLSGQAGRNSGSATRPRVQQNDHRDIYSYPKCPIDRSYNRRGEAQCIFWVADRKCYCCSRGHYFTGREA